MLCPPSLIYLVISLIGLVGSLRFHNVGLISMLISFLFIMLWTWLLNFLCFKKQGALAWILLFLPVVLFIAIIAVAFEVAIYNKAKTGAANVQPVYKNR